MSDPTYNDLMLDWLEVRTGLTDLTVNDQWLEFLNATEETINDAQLAYWHSEGFPGTYNQAARAWEKDQGIRP